MNQDTIQTLVAQLNGWFAANQRPLPWRVDSSVYRTVVSEFMCQQTQIVTVLPYFKRWTTRWPDFASLAAASEEEVLSAWQGLGYYSRAKRLHQLAKDWCLAEVKPVTSAQWQRFPGIGPYTAAAIASIHFNEPLAVVDGNVIRVLSRLFALEEVFGSQQSAVAAVSSKAAMLMDAAKTPGVHNQAMMELGAVVCTKARPSCLLCPLQQQCSAYRLGLADVLPRIRRAATKTRRNFRLWCVKGGKLLLQKYADNAKRLAGMYELPEVASALIDHRAKVITTFKRGISNERIEEVVICVEDLDPAFLLPRMQPQLFWADVKAIKTLALSGPHRKCIESLLNQYPLCQTHRSQKQ